MGKVGIWERGCKAFRPSATPLAGMRFRMDGRQVLSASGTQVEQSLALYRV